MKPLPWPDVTGARNSDGHLCVGAHPSRSKHCRTLLEFYRPEGNYRTLATDVSWLQHDLRTIAVLTVALRDLIEQKIKALHPGRAIGFCGSGVTTQLNDSGLFLYEAGSHATLYPRFWWAFPIHMTGAGHAPTIALVTRWEALRPDVLVGNRDSRLGVSLSDHKHDRNSLPRFDSSWDEWLDEYLAQRKAG